MYPARSDEGWHVVVGGRAGPRFEAIGELQVSGERVAYGALDDEGWRVVVNGEPGPRFASIRAGSLRFEGGRVLYVGRDAAGERVVVDGRPGPSFERVSTPIVGAKGALVAYVGAKEGRAHVVIGGAMGPPFDEVLALRVAEDEPRWSALVRRGDTVAMVRDDLHAPPTPMGGAVSDLVLSADGAHVAWLERAAAEPVEVWFDGRLAGRHAEVTRLAFVPRTGRLVYVAIEGERARVHHDGARGPSFASIESLVTSRAGRWGYVARRSDGQHVVMLDGRVVHRAEWAGALALARSSNAFAFIARDEGRRYVVSSAGRVEVGRPIVDALVLTDDGCWAVTVARPDTRRVDIVASTGTLATLDFEEAGSAALQGRSPVEVVRAIVAGELSRARRERRACQAR